MIKFILTLLCVTFLFIPVHSAKYVGAKKCKLCHNSVRHGDTYNILYKTKHSKAFEGLVSDGKEDDPYCVECHTTGFGKGGYMIGSANAFKFEGVQCEECHGPGSDYIDKEVMKDKKKAISKGLVIPTKETCMKCHDKRKYPWAKEFNYKKRLKKIDHRYL